MPILLRIMQYSTSTSFFYILFLWNYYARFLQLKDKVSLRKTRIPKASCGRDMPTDNNFHKSSNNHIKVNTAEFSRHLDVQIKTTCGPHMPTAVAIRIQSSPSSFFLKFSLNSLNTSLLENPSKKYCHWAVHCTVWLQYMSQPHTDIAIYVLYIRSTHCCWKQWRIS